MLRSSYKNEAHKVLPVPLLCESENKVVEIEVTDTETGESIGKRYDQIASVKKLSEESAVAQESADLYSIENMQKVGFQPVVCPNGGYIRNGIGAIEKVEFSANEMLSNLPDVETKTKE